MIKHIITTAFVALTGLVSLNAAPVPVNFGGFNKSQAFSLTVRERSVGTVIGSTVVENPSVPSTIPNLAVGQLVNFTIGAKGELKGTKINIPLFASASNVNNYVTPLKRGSLSNNQAIVYKVGSNPSTPTEINLTFFLVKVSRSGSTTTTVEYKLN